jgi:hypothetical protein
MKSRASARPNTGQQFVDGQFLTGQHRVAGSLLDREEPRVGCQVEFRPVGGVGNGQPGEAVTVETRST